MHPKTSNRPHAFTLLEMSVVMVIIGLIFGGVVVGDSLYQNAKLMSIASDAEKIRGAMKNFKDKYEYYPGDFPNATNIWGAMTSPVCENTGNVAITGYYSTTPVSLTCNGRGNGVIGMYFNDAAQFATTGFDTRESRERFYVWQHLALAEYIEGIYSGYSKTNGNNDAVAPGINIPATKYSNLLGFTIEYQQENYTSQLATRSWPVQGRIGHLFSWSHPGTTVGYGSSALINSVDARKLDNKIDDGKPFSGNLFAHGRDNGSSGTYTDVDDCTTGTDYKVDDEYACGQYYRNFLEE